MRLFETLAIQNGKVNNLTYHNQRFFLGQKFLGISPISIKQCLESVCLQNKHINNKDFFKAKIVYGLGGIEVFCEEYVPKPIHSFLMLACDKINYRYKYENRSMLQALLSQRGECDEVIVVKHGCVSDCTIGNLLFLKNGRWYTPDTPLLQGTQRAFLLQEGLVFPKRILWHGVFGYEKIMMVNALNPFEPKRMIDIENIKVPNE